VSGEIQAAVLTTHSVSDDAMVETLLSQIETPLEQYAVDGGYDNRKVYTSLQNH